MRRHFNTWLCAQKQVSRLREKQFQALRALCAENRPFLLKRGRMRPTLVTITDVSTHDLVQVMRLDTGVTRWVYMYHLSEPADQTPQRRKGA